MGVFDLPVIPAPEFLAAVVNLTLGLVVLQKGKDKFLNRAFFLLAITLALWNLAYFALTIARDAGTAKQWFCALGIGTILAPAAHYRFARIFARRKNQIIEKVFWALGLLFWI
ncbi:MAG: hypothetical protein M0021_15980 [Clostridia bacterium]|nr:hypothetical protein [Clostridia bacterium]